MFVEWLCKLSVSENIVNRLKEGSVTKTHLYFNVNHQSKYPLYPIFYFLQFLDINPKDSLSSDFKFLGLATEARELPVIS